MDLSTYRGANRLLLVFAPSASDGRAGRQRELLEGRRAGLEHRDLLEFRLVEDGPGEAENGPVSPRESARLRRAFDVVDGSFALVLVGKDGGAKFRSDEPLPARDIFDRIDAMPMRRREMREQERDEVPGHE